MKKLLIVSSFVMVFTLRTVQAQPYQYEVAPAGAIGFTTHEYIAPGGTISLDIYLTGVGEPQHSGGVWIDFSASTADLSYMSAGIASPPWDPPGPSVTFFPPGTVMIVVGSLAGAPPDFSGNLAVGTFTLQNLGPGANDATVNLTTIPGLATWTPINDSDVTPGAIVISEVCPCTTDAECDDGIFCNGVETCDPICVCSTGTPPCDDGYICTLDCDEDTDSCLSDTCDTTQTVNPTDFCCTDPASPCGPAGADPQLICSECEGDLDCDGVLDEEDNCPTKPNGPSLGKCTAGKIGYSCSEDYDCNVHGRCRGFCATDYPPMDGMPCLGPYECNVAGICNNNQGDTYPPQGNGIGDACDCEGDFDCSGGVDANDVSDFLEHFGRSQYNRPCTSEDPCKGDFTCNGNVDAADVTKFLEDFGRSQYNNPCPACEVGIPWCVYP